MVRSDVMVQGIGGEWVVSFYNVHPINLEMVAQELEAEGHIVRAVACGRSKRAGQVTYETSVVGPCRMCETLLVSSLCPACGHDNREPINRRVA